MAGQDTTLWNRVRNDRAWTTRVKDPSQTHAARSFCTKLHRTPEVFFQFGSVFTMLLSRHVPNPRRSDRGDRGWCRVEQLVRDLTVNQGPPSVGFGREVTCDIGGGYRSATGIGVNIGVIKLEECPPVHIGVHQRDIPSSFSSTINWVPLEDESCFLNIRATKPPANHLRGGLGGIRDGPQGLWSAREEVAHRGHTIFF